VSSAGDGAPRLVLASRSPQRRAILEQLRIPFDTVDVDVEELSAGDPIAVVTSNALRKAQAGAAKRPGETVLGVDTVVCLDGEIFGKPADEREAEKILKRLSGRTHEVVSGLALIGSADPQVVHEVTKVTFRDLGDELLRSYVATGEWSGRAGGYAIQGQGAALVRRIMGDYLNVVGLPVGKMLDLDLRLMLRES
jgi:septum formation protein